MAYGHRFDFDSDAVNASIHASSLVRRKFP